MGSTPLVSVVTPFYNTREFLLECIESVLRQTYENWEYVLVDNCSTDGSTDIAAEYAARLPEKIRCVRTPSFLSQVQNYNFALSCISDRSKYCKIVQADDWLFADCIRSMVELAEAHPAIGLVGAYELEGDQVSLDGLPYPSAEVGGRDVCRLYFLQKIYTFGTPTSILMRSDVVRARNPFYDERYAPFEDAHSCFDVLRTWNFGFVHQVLTYTRRQEDSIIAKLLPLGLLAYLHLSILVVHGRDYLSDEEYSHCLAGAERRYFLHLARSVCSFRSGASNSWEIHRNWLASINCPLNWRVLLPWIPRAVLEGCWSKFWKTWDREG